MSRIWEVMKHEFHEVLPPTIFFLVAFHIVILDRILLLRQYCLPLSSQAGATVGARRDPASRLVRPPARRGGGGRGGRAPRREDLAHHGQVPVRQPLSGQAAD